MSVPPTLISPARGFSRPAIERSVVVLPQPEGPSSVKSFPAGTSKVTSWAARTTLPRSSAYSVHSPLTFSTSGFLDSETPSDQLGDEHQEEQADDEHYAERRELDVLAVLPQFPDEDRQHLGVGAVEQDRAWKLADRDDDDVDPTGHQPRFEQRQDDAPEGGGPRGAAHRRRLLQLLVDLQHRGRVVAQPVGHEARDI